MKPTGPTSQKCQEASQFALAAMFLIASSIETTAAVNWRPKSIPQKGPILVQNKELEGVAAIYVKNKKGHWDYVGNGSYFPQDIGIVGRGSYYPMNNGVELTMHEGFRNEFGVAEQYEEREIKVKMGDQEFIGKTVHIGDQASTGEFIVDRLFVTFEDLPQHEKQELSKVNGLHAAFVKVKDDEDLLAFLKDMDTKGFDPVIVGQSKAAEGDMNLYAINIYGCGEINAGTDGFFTFDACDPKYLRSGGPLMFRHRGTGKFYKSTSSGLPRVYGYVTDGPRRDIPNNPNRTIFGNLAAIKVEPRSPGQ